MGDTSSNCWNFPLFIVSLRAEKHLPMTNHLVKWGAHPPSRVDDTMLLQIGTDKFAGMDSHPGPGFGFLLYFVDMIFFSS